MSPQTKSGRSSASSAVSTSGIGSSSDIDHNTSTAMTHHVDDVFPGRDNEPPSSTSNDASNDIHSDTHKEEHSDISSAMQSATLSDTHSETTETEVVVVEDTQQYKQHDQQHNEQHDDISTPRLKH